ncbi:MAG: hypothetical protein PHE24_01335 [Patescibacteria group bacterium]|nr:hypothetical protein [Patescibacteria group bacterium]
MFHKTICLALATIIGLTMITNCAKNSPTGPSGNPDILSVSNIFPVSIDYSLSLDSMISLSNYGCYRPDYTTENFPVTGHGKVQVDLQFVQFKDHTPDKNLLNDLDNAGFRPGTLPELLIFGQYYPDESKTHVILEIGSIWNDEGCPRIPYTYWNEQFSKVTITLSWLDTANGYLSRDIRVLAVRK